MAKEKCMSDSRKPAISSADNQPSAEASPLTEQAYFQIRRDILAGTLAAGTKLKIEALRARYNIGPTPVREALERLATERLAHMERQRGFRVAPMTALDLIELTDMRILLESEALRRSLSAGDYAWEGAIVSAFHKLDRLRALELSGTRIDPEEWERRNREFHGALVAAAGSGWLARSYAHIDDHLERYRRCFRDILVAARRDCHEEHHAIMEAALARDAARAIELTQLHIKRTADVVQPALQAQSSRRMVHR
jgi:GntR family transcriptional regulator, carbon starvation induced regulator